MSLVQSVKYICNQCKEAFRYNNQCRCPICRTIIDANICLSCHNNNHIKQAGTFMVAMAILAGITEIWSGIL